METILIIWFNYFLLHFIKNVNFIYAIVIVFFIWELFFGNLFIVRIHYMDLSWKTHSDEFIPRELYPSWGFNETEGKTTFPIVKTTINSILLPWTSFGVIGKSLSSGGDKLLSQKHYWMDLLHSSIF